MGLLVGLLGVIRTNSVLKVRSWVRFVSWAFANSRVHEHQLTIRWSVGFLHYRLDGIRSRAVIACQTTNRRLPMARYPDCRLFPLVPLVQDEERGIPLRTLVLGSRFNEMTHLRRRW